MIVLLSSDGGNVVESKWIAGVGGRCVDGIDAEKNVLDLPFCRVIYHTYYLLTLPKYTRNIPKKWPKTRVVNSAP